EVLFRSQFHAMESGHHVRTAFEFCPRSGGTEATGGSLLSQVRHQPQDRAQVVEALSVQPGRRSVGSLSSTAVFARSNSRGTGGGGSAGSRYFWLGSPEDLGLPSQPGRRAETEPRLTQRANTGEHPEAAWSHRQSRPCH